MFLHLNFIIFFVSLNLVISKEEGFTCRDMNNKHVDWYILYKLPRVLNVSDMVSSGKAFIYMDANNIKWNFPNTLMNETNHAVYYTLQQYYDSKNNTVDNFYILYNDENQNSKLLSQDSGMPKGVAQFDKNGGFWLIHSIPEFPNILSYDFSLSGEIYGQMGICISFNYTALDAIATQLYYTNPSVYARNVPKFMVKDFPSLQNIIDNIHKIDKPYTSMASLKSIGGQEFLHFAKTGLYDQDLYYGFVAQHLASSFIVQSWIRGCEIYSTCIPPNPFNVYNAKYIVTPFLNFSTLKDHSKFAIAHAENGHPSPYQCIGDIDRMPTQIDRGGGIMCFSDAAVFAVFRQLINTFEQCAGVSPPTISPELTEDPTFSISTTTKDISTLSTTRGDTSSTSATTYTPTYIPVKSEEKWWIIGAFLIIFIFMATFIIIYFLRKKYRQKRFEKIQETIKTKMELSPLEIKLSHEERLTKQIDSKNIIIDFDNILGKGANATVYKVYIKGGKINSNINDKNNKLKFSDPFFDECHAALKLPTSFDHDEVEQFVRELDALITLGTHKNIITFFGWTLYHDIPALITELASTNLLQYVKLFRGEILPVKSMISILWQISQALEHVASLNMVHRDVACRNILLTNGNIVAKLADFGLCCHCDESFTYQATLHKRMPIKWLSIEALVDRIFSEKSDVWSFGILCYEIFSFGSVPYSALTNEEMLEFLRANKRLEKPKDTPETIYSLMLDCWKMDPLKRPKFTDIVNSLRIMLENETASYGYLILSQE